MATTEVKREKGVKRENGMRNEKGLHHHTTPTNQLQE
jgi:hypothetical protein